MYEQPVPVAICTIPIPTHTHIHACEHKHTHTYTHTTKPWIGQGKFVKRKDVTRKEKMLIEVIGVPMIAIYFNDA